MAETFTSSAMIRLCIRGQGRISKKRTDTDLYQVNIWLRIYLQGKAEVNANTRNRYIFKCFISFDN